MKVARWIVVPSLVLGFLLAGGLSPAEAAKGVKKNSGNEHKLHGKVLAVHHKSKGHGSLVIHIEHHHAKKKTGTTASTANVNNSQNTQKKRKHEITVTVSAKTKFIVAHKGKQGGGQHLSSVHKGDHVVVLEHKHHADVVMVHHHHAKKSVSKKA